MYISVADSRIRGFLKWADTHEPNGIREGRADADEESIIAAPDLADEVTAYPEHPHRPWLAPGAGRL
jgi:hypothetical protein